MYYARIYRINKMYESIISDIRKPNLSKTESRYLEGMRDAIELVMDELGINEE